jgi:hypothetical protein
MALFSESGFYDNNIGGTSVADNLVLSRKVAVYEQR